MVPGRMRWLAMLCSNSSAKLSVMFSLKLFPSTTLVPEGLPKNNGDQSLKAALLRQTPKRQTPAGHFQDTLDHRIDGHPRCIQQNRVGACDERRSGASGIAQITLRYLQRKGGKVSS